MKGLSAVNFRPDPIAGPEFSKITSITSSAFKRHGYILERAVFEALTLNDRFIVWNEPAFFVSNNADLIVNDSLRDPKSIFGNSLEYKEGKRTLQVDVLVYDKDKKTLNGYEIKRGTGKHDSGKTRSILRDLLCVHVLLKSYGLSKKLDVDTAHSYIIHYYGERSIKPPFSLVREELDEHFRFPIVELVEEVNRYYRDSLLGVLEAI